MSMYTLMYADKAKVVCKDCSRQMYVASVYPNKKKRKVFKVEFQP